MNELLFYFLLGTFVAIPLGIITGILANICFDKLYHPKATIRLGTNIAWRRSTHIASAIRKLRGKGPLPEIDIFTDGSFIDTAVFMIVAVEAAKKIPQAKLTLRQVDWSSLPYAIERSSTAICYLDRKSTLSLKGKFSIWSNLGSFHGYALIGRPEVFSKSCSSLSEANLQLEELARTRKLKVLTFGPDLIEVLKTPLMPIFLTDRVIIQEHNAEYALDRFLHGDGDLFIAGLPHRLECVRRGFVEIATSQIHPFMFAIDILGYKGNIELEVLEALSSEWSRICRRMISNRAFCEEIFDRWTTICKALDITPQFGRDDFLLVTHDQVGLYHNFFTGRDDAAVELIKAVRSVTKISVEVGIDDDQTKHIIDSIFKNYIGVTPTQSSPAVLTSHHTPPG